MNVLLDAHFLDKKKEGNRTFIRALIYGLDAAGSGVGDLRFFIAVYEPETWSRRFSSSRLNWVTCSRSAWRRYLLDFPRLVRKHDIHLIQHTYHFPLLRIPTTVSKILVVHDILPLTHPGQFSFLFRQRFRFLLQRSLKRADRVVCGSNFTRAALVRELKLSASRIRVIPYGVCAFPHARDPENAESDRDHTALYVGRLDRRKNLDKILDIIEAVNRLMPVKLILAGRKENVGRNTLTRINRLSGQGMVRCLGQVGDETLESLYRTAGVLLYFPVAEGFGYPVLEAMARGLPYLSVAAGAIPELASPENLVDPQDPDSVAKKIVRIFSDPDFRQHLIGEGLQQAQRYSVEVMGGNFISLYGEFQ